MTILITISICFFVSIILYNSYKYYKKYKNINYLKSKNLPKIIEIVNDIFDSINSRVDEPYYNNLYSDTLNSLHQITGMNDDDINSIQVYNNDTLTNIDKLKCDIKRDLRIMDEFNEFNDKFTYRKRRYKSVFDSSINILNLLEERYSTEVVNKYIVNFDSDYSNIKSNEINDLNILMKDTNTLYEKYQIKKFKKSFDKIKKHDCDIITKLSEPNRLRDKFILSEDNIDQLESDLVNDKGTLYQKVLNIIKDNKVPKNLISEWNSIKRNINNFNKNRLLKSDTIELNDKLNNIIKRLTELNNKISLNIEVPKEAMINNTIGEKTN